MLSQKEILVAKQGEKREENNLKEIEKSHCNSCSGNRNHELLHRESSRWEEVWDQENRISIEGGDTYELLRCCGCESVSMKHSQWFSEDCDEYGQPNEGVTYYPPATLRRKRDWRSSLKVHGNLLDLPEHLAEPLDEIYIALHNKCLRLAAMGVRSLLEAIMFEKVGDKKSFVTTIKAFYEEGYLSKIQKDVVDAVIETGHAVTHRGYSPNISDIITLLDVVENLIETLYVNTMHGSYLKGRVPVRKSTIIK
jgi:hypothetical protein